MHRDHHIPPLCVFTSSFSQPHLRSDLKIAFVLSVHTQSSISLSSWEPTVLKKRVKDVDGKLAKRPTCGALGSCFFLVFCLNHEQESWEQKARGLDWRRRKALHGNWYLGEILAPKSGSPGGNRAMEVTRKKRTVREIKWLYLRRLEHVYRLLQFMHFWFWSYLKVCFLCAFFLLASMLLHRNFPLHPRPRP